MSTAACAWAIDGCSPGAIAAWAFAARARASASILLGGLHFVERVVIAGARGEALLQQCLLASQRILLDREIGLLAGDVRARAGGLRRAAALRLQLGCGELRLGVLQRDLERRRIDLEQHVAALHLGAVLDEDLLDRTRHLRADRNDVLLHECESSVDTLPPLVSQ